MIWMLFAVSWTRSLRRFEMRAENFTVAGVMSLNRQIRRTSSVSAKSGRQSGRPVGCAVTRALEAGESGLHGLARAITVRAFADAEFAAKKCRGGLVSGAAEASGSRSVLRDESSIVTGEFLSSTVDSTIDCNPSRANCLNDLGSGENGGLLSDVVGEVDSGIWLSLRMVGATLILADTDSSAALLWSDSKSERGTSEAGSGSPVSVREFGNSSMPERSAVFVGFDKVGSAIGASKVKPSLCSAQVSGADRSVSSLIVPTSHAAASAEVDTGDCEARLIASAVANEDCVFAEGVNLARRGACALLSRTKLDSKSGAQWSVQ